MSISIIIILIIITIISSIIQINVRVATLNLFSDACDQNGYP